MRHARDRHRGRLLGSLFTAGVCFQLGGCEFGEITTTTTLDGRDLVVSLVRGAILTPLDTFLTQAVDEFFQSDK